MAHKGQAFLGTGKKEAVFFASATALNLLFIWGNSLFSRQESQAISNWSEQVVRPVLHVVLAPVAPLKAIDAIDIRKLAHFGEFLTLGFFACGTLRPIYRHDWWLLAAVLCPLAAAVDELLQFVSARAPMARDVALDASGAWCGIALFALAAWAAGAVRRRGRLQKEGNSRV